MTEISTKVKTIHGKARPSDQLSATLILLLTALANAWPPLHSARTDCPVKNFQDSADKIRTLELGTDENLCPAVSSVFTCLPTPDAVATVRR